MNIKGKLIEKFDVQNVSEKFKKREFVVEFIENNPQYPEYIKFEATQEKVTIIDGFNVGDMVDVAFNLRGRSWVNQQGVKNYFNSLQAWRVTAADNASAGAPQQSYQSAPPQYANATPIAAATDGDDLPF